MNKPIKLTTLETESLLSQYPEIEFLEAGHIGEWLITRKDQLLTLAQQERLGSSLAKTVSAITLISGAFFIYTSPLAPIGLLLGAGSYVWSQVIDTETTHSFNPFPFIRGGILKVIGSVGHKNAREEFFESYNTFEELCGYLTPHERQEYTMIREYSALVCEYLSQIEEGKRFYAYRWLVDQYTLLSGSFPTPEQMGNHVNSIELPSTFVDSHRLNEIKQALLPQSSSLTKELPSPSFTSLPKPNLVDGEQLPLINQADNSNSSHQFPQDRKSSPSPPPPVSIKQLPLKQRSVKIVELIKNSGLRIDECLSGQITAIASNQRGGKGTLAGLLSILIKASNPQLEVHYHTAGLDTYPFACHLSSAWKYPGRSLEDADRLVAQELIKFLKNLENSQPYSHQNKLVVIDELMRLFDLMSETDKDWTIKFLLSRFAKTGAQLIIVLHAANLSSVVGGKTNGLAETFKTGINFIGCDSQSVEVDFLRKMFIASGKYFKANPNNFSTAIKQGELGEVPDWLKTEKHPGNGHPDPVRTLLKYFPEFYQEHSLVSKNSIPNTDKLGSLEDINKLEFTLQLDEEVKDFEIKDIHQADNSFNLSEAAIKVFNWLQSKEHGKWFYYRKSGDIERNSAFQKFLHRLGDIDIELVFLELLDVELVDLSDDGFGIRLL